MLASDLNAPRPSRSAAKGLEEKEYEFSITLYEEVDPDRSQISVISRLRKSYTDLAGSFPYVIRMFRDVLSIPGCRPHLAVFGLTELGLALVPAASIW